MSNYWIVLIHLSILSPIFVESEEKTTKPCWDLYEKGVSCYLENDFVNCVLRFEEALTAYHDYCRELQNCRLTCTRETEMHDPLYPIDIEHLSFYEKAIRNTLCLMKCKNSSVGLAETHFRKDMEKVFEDRKPYQYLHICYNMTKRYQKAASAAFTYLITNPKDAIMLENLKLYSIQKEVDMNEIVNFEASDYVYLYIHGADAYEKKNWVSVENNMEQSIESYLQAEEECRALCEGPFDQGWFPDFIPSISNHFAYVLRCKRKCVKKLGTLNGERHDDLFPSHYHYLQFAYYKLGKLKRACEAAVSYLLFLPEDETMLSNVKYYKTLPKVDESYFVPREEALHYVRRQDYEENILKFIDTEFKLYNSSRTEISIKNGEDVYVTNNLPNDVCSNGSRRFVLEGLASENECNILFEAVRIFAEQGDGYRGNSFPHTTEEIFEGLTLGRAALLVHFGLMDPKTLELLLEISEKARMSVVRIFDLKRALYFTYTHLVCRSARRNSSKERTDLSHAVHADNCNISKDGTCERSPPAYAWRDYSAIVYLNSNFEGGEFIFSSDLEAQLVQSSIKPRCGRMVAFSSGAENLHGVKAVTRGSRCALGVWFTFDANYNENDRKTAQQLIFYPE